MVPTGSQLTFAVDGQVDTGITDWRTTPDDLRTAVINSLRLSLTVNAVVVTPLSVIVAFGDWRYTAMVSVTTKTAHAQADDVGSIVAHAFYEGAGALPTVTVTNAPVPTAAGGITEGPGVFDGIGSGVHDAVDGVAKTISDALAKLGSGIGQGVGNAAKPATDLLVIGAVGVVVIIYILAKSPQTGAVARAVRP